MTERKNKNVKQRGNGEGTIYYSDTLQKWVAQYIDPSGKRKTITQRRNEKVCDFKKRFTSIMNNINTNNYIINDNKTILSILEDYIEDKHSNNITSDRSYTRDKQTLEQLKNSCNTIIDMPIQKITFMHINSDIHNITKYSDNSISKIWRLLTKAFRLAVSYRIITYNPMENENLKKPKSIKETSKVEALTIEEQKKLVNVLSSADSLYNKILLIQMYTGMRIGEVLALTNDCIDLYNKQILINKTLTTDINYKFIVGKTTKTKNGIRLVPITPMIYDIFLNLKKSNVSNIHNLIFYDYDNDRIINPSMINCYLHRLNEKYEIAPKIHTHMLRHTYATRCIESGMSPKVLQKLLGHANIKTTLDTYTSVFDKFSNEENEKYISYMLNQF